MGFIQGSLRGLLMWRGFFLQTFSDEECGDFLFLGGEGAEVGDALELIVGEGGLEWGLRLLAAEVAGGAGVEGDEADACKLLKALPGGLVEDVELWRAAAPFGLVEEG